MRTAHDPPSVPPVAYRDAVMESDLTSAQKWLATVLARFADFDTGENVRPGMAHLLRLSSMSERSVI